jgi:hypothetical protein
MKQHLVAFFSSKITDANHWLPCLCKLPHSHVTFWSRQSAMCSLTAHQLWTNKMQCQDIFSISQQLGTRLRCLIRFVLPKVPLSVSFIQKRVTWFKEIQYSFEWAKKLQWRYGQVTPRFKPRSGHVGFVVDKVALWQVFSEYLGFPCQSFHRFLHYHNHPGLTQ